MKRGFLDELSVLLQNIFLHFPSSIFQLKKDIASLLKLGLMGETNHRYF